MANARKQERSKGRRARVPFGGLRTKMQLSDEDRKEFDRRGVVPRWINDQDGRLARAQSGGYNFVKPEHVTSLGQGALHGGSTDEGSRVSLVVTKGEPVIRAYLMEIKKKYYDEDQASKEARNQKVDDDLAVGNAGGASIEHQYGAGVTYSH